MPTTIITSKTLAIVILTSAGQDVAGFIMKLPKQLLIQA